MLFPMVGTAATPRPKQLRLHHRLRHQVYGRPDLHLRRLQPALRLRFLHHSADRNTLLAPGRHRPAEGTVLYQNVGRAAPQRCDFSKLSMTVLTSGTKPGPRYDILPGSVPRHNAVTQYSPQSVRGKVLGLSHT